LCKDAGVKFWDDNGQRLGAALAFYSALSLSPLVLAVVAITGFVFGEAAARGQLVEKLRDTIGQDAAVVVQQLVAQTAISAHGILAAVVAFLVLLYGASGVFTELQSDLNMIWRVPGQKRKSGILTMIRERLMAFSLVAGTALLLLASLVFSAVLNVVENQVSGWVPHWTWLAGVLNLLLPLFLTVGLFAMIFKWLPETELAWSDVWLGAAVTAVLFTVGRYLIGMYLGRAAVGSPYGAAGAFVVLMVWLYYSTQILLFGAELTFVYARRFGHGLEGNPAQQQPLAQQPRLAPG
jgi:membrane protein